jgi:PadR family transcriptional regulator
MNFASSKGTTPNRRGFLKRAGGGITGGLLASSVSSARSSAPSDPLHGWAIAKRIQVLSGEVLSVGQGSLYPALHRLEQQGWLRAQWKDSDLGRPAKFYSLTREGRKQLERELHSWNRLSSAVQLLIATA